MKTKKKLVLIPSAYNHRAMGDVENFIEYYKEDMDVYIITDQEMDGDELIEDGVTYVRKGAKKALYLEVTAEYIIDAGTISGTNKLSSTQKRISVWHGTPYKKMFVDLAREHIISGLDYASMFDLMVSPSAWYTEHFLRNSMLYDGEVLETAISRTDSLFLSDEEQQEIRKQVGIPEGKKVLLYAPTFRERGEFALPFSPQKMMSVLGDEWVIVVKLHYLNQLKPVEGVVDATDYSSVNHLLTIADFMITDYSSLLFDYSVLEKPALLFQYDRASYENDRSFMFRMEDYVNDEDIIFTEDALYEKMRSVESMKNNMSAIKEEFYPHQHERATADLVKELALDTGKRGMKEVIFLVNDLNEIGGIHTFVLNLAREFKTKYNAKVILIGNSEFNKSKGKAYVFDGQGYVDLKLSMENNAGIVNSILSSTDGYIISTQYGGHMRFQKFLKGKRVVLMFHGDTKDLIRRYIYEVQLDGYNNEKVYNYRRLAFLTEGNCDLIKPELKESVRKKAIYIENGMDFEEGPSLYQENGEFALVSRLDRDKNPVEAIDIFMNEKLDPSYRLHIYGDGALKAEMEQKIADAGLQDRIILHGFVSDKKEIYGNKQGVISTSLTDGLPLTLLESIQYGVPVYVYDSFTACRDMVTEKTGRLIETGNQEAFVEALNNAFDMNAFDSREIKEKFSNKVITEKWMALFAELDEEVAREMSKTAADVSAAANAPATKSSFKKRLKKSLKNGLLKNEFTAAKLGVMYRNLKTGSKNKSLPMVSVIMPYYYNRKTVEKAVKSVVKSGYPNYEIVLVNDGSDDDPRPLLKNYKNVQYLYKENGGLSSARNFGMDHAKGKYVIFLDSDDILYPGALNKLVDYAEKHKLDMVIGKTLRHYVSKNKDEDWYPGVTVNTYVNTRKSRFHVIDDTIATGKLYSLDMLRKNNIQFQDGLYEDVLFTGQLYALLDEIGVIHRKIQIWMVYGTGTSITTSNTLDNVKARMKNVNYIFGLHDEITKVYYTRQYIRHQMVASVNGYKNFTDEEKRELYDLLREGMLMREPYVVDQMIIVPSKKLLYQSLLADDFEKFDLVAEGFSEKYFAFHEKEEQA